MSKTVLIPEGILTMAESKAVCPKCGRKIPFDEIEEQFMKQNNHKMRIRCSKCKRFIRITTDIQGDYRAF